MSDFICDACGNRLELGIPFNEKTPLLPCAYCIKEAVDAVLPLPPDCPVHTLGIGGLCACKNEDWLGEAINRARRIIYIEHIGLGTTLPNDLEAIISVAQAFERSQSVETSQDSTAAASQAVDGSHERT